RSSSTTAPTSSPTPPRPCAAWWSTMPASAWRRSAAATYTASPTCRTISKAACAWTRTCWRSTSPSPAWPGSMPSSLRWSSCAISAGCPRPRSPPCWTAPTAASAATGRRRGCTCWPRCRADAAGRGRPGGPGLAQPPRGVPRTCLRTRAALMDAERWQRLSPLLDALLELDEAARASSLASLREEDAQLADDLEELLALEAGSEDFLSEPLITPHPGVHAGASVGPYELERMLGEGGMGQVWLARRADGLYERRVALKLLRPGLADPGLRLRFTRER